MCLIWHQECIQYAWIFCNKFSNCLHTTWHALLCSFSWCIISILNGWLFKLWYNIQWTLRLFFVLSVWERWWADWWQLCNMMFSPLNICAEHGLESVTASPLYHFDTHSNRVLWVGATCLVAVINHVVINNFTVTFLSLTKQIIISSTRENSTGILRALSNAVIFLKWLTTAKTLTGLLACLIFQQWIFFCEVTWRPNGMKRILPAPPT